jgi:hypothetical protein
MINWQRAPTRRVGFYADHLGRRLFVEQTVRSMRAHGLVGDEFAGFVGGIRVGEFKTLDRAQRETITAAHRKSQACPDMNETGAS